MSAPTYDHAPPSADEKMSASASSAIVLVRYLPMSSEALSQPILRLPSDIIHHSLANQFLSDKETVYLAQTNSRLFHTLKGVYQIKKGVVFYIAEEPVTMVKKEEEKTEEKENVEDEVMVTAAPDSTTSTSADSTTNDPTAEAAAGLSALNPTVDDSTTPTMSRYMKAIHNHQSQDPTELSFAVDDIITIRTYDHSWCEGELNGKIGIVPRSFLTNITATITSSSSSSSSSSNSTEARLQPVFSVQLKRPIHVFDMSPGNPSFISVERHSVSVLIYPSRDHPDDVAVFTPFHATQVSSRRIGLPTSITVECFLPQSTDPKIVTNPSTQSISTTHSSTTTKSKKNTIHSPSPSRFEQARRRPAQGEQPPPKEYLVTSKVLQKRVDASPEMKELREKYKRAKVGYQAAQKNVKEAGQKKLEETTVASSALSSSSSSSITEASSSSNPPDPLTLATREMSQRRIELEAIQKELDQAIQELKQEIETDEKEKKEKEKEKEEEKQINATKAISDALATAMAAIPPLPPGMDPMSKDDRAVARHKAVQTAMNKAKADTAALTAATEFASTSASASSSAASASSSSITSSLPEWKQLELENKQHEKNEAKEETVVASTSSSSATTSSSVSSAAWPASSASSMPSLLTNPAATSASAPPPPIYEEHDDWDGPPIPTSSSTTTIEDSTTTALPKKPARLISYPRVHGLQFLPPYVRSLTLTSSCHPQSHDPKVPFHALSFTHCTRLSSLTCSTHFLHQSEYPPSLRSLTVTCVSFPHSWSARTAENDASKKKETPIILPPSLTYLDTPEYVKIEEKEELPQKLETWICGEGLSSADILPATLTSLTLIKASFLSLPISSFGLLNAVDSSDSADLADKQQLQWTPPPNLKYLEFGPRCNPELGRVVWHEQQCNLTHLKLGVAFYSSSFAQMKFPSSLRHLDFDTRSLYDSAFHPSLQLTAITSFVLPRYWNQDIYEFHLPYQLRNLEWSQSMNQRIDALMFPSTLTRIVFGRNFNQSLEAVRFPSGLKHLEFSTEDGRFRGPLPADGLEHCRELETLVLGSSWNRPNEELHFAQTLTTLKLGDTFNQSLENLILPPNLTFLQFGESFNQDLSTMVLPPRLEKFELTHEMRFSRFQHLESLMHLKLPESVWKIVVPIRASPKLNKELQERYQNYLAVLPFTVKVVAKASTIG